MPGIVDLKTLLNTLEPNLSRVEYVFLSIKDGADYAHLEPLATFHEDEGLSLVVSRSNAEQADIAFDSTFRLLTLKVHSSLEAVGLTAAVSGALAEQGISANVIAAYHHDHILVPAHQADDALATLHKLSGELTK